MTNTNNDNKEKKGGFPWILLTGIVVTVVIVAIIVAALTSGGGNTSDQDELDQVRADATATAKAASTSDAPSATPTAKPATSAAPASTGSTVKSGRDSNLPEWLGSECKLAPSIPGVKERVQTTYTAADSLAYPQMLPADPNRSGEKFPDSNPVAYGHYPRVGYDVSFQNGDYFEDCFGDTDVPQYYWRVETTGYFWIPESKKTPDGGISCMADEHKGCALIIINHFGPTMKINGVYDDNGFTVAGPVWDMSSPDKVTAAAQDLVDHYVYRMIYADGKQNRNDGTNCGVIEGCNSVEWHVVVYGNGILQKHWSGLFTQ